MSTLPGYRTTTSVVPKVALYGTAEGERVHLLAEVHAEWRKRDKPFYRTVAVCGSSVRSGTLIAEIPDDRRLCEECIWPDEQPCVYRVFGENDELIYAGYSGRLLRRLDQHRRGTPWWHEAVRVEWTDYPSAVEALHAEHLLLRSHRPRHNWPSGRRAARTLPPTLHHLYDDFRALQAA